MNYFIDTIALVGIIISIGGAYTAYTVVTRLEHAKELAALNQQLQDGIAAIQILNQQYVASLAHSENLRREFATVFDNVTDGLIVFGCDYRQRHSNVVARDYYGVYESQQTVQALFAHIQMYDLEGTAIPFEDFPIMQVLAGGVEETTTIMRIIGLRSTSMIGIVYSVPLYNDASEITGALLGIRDVTMDYSNARRVATIRAVAHACTHAVDIPAVAQSALTELLTHIQIPYGLLLIRSHDHPSYARIVGSVAIAEPLQLLLEEQLHHLLIAADSPWRSLQSLATGLAYYNEALPFTIAPVESVDPLEAAYQSIRCLPLRFQESTIGVLVLLDDTLTTVMHEEPDEETLSDVCEEIATSLHRARLYEDARRMSLYDSLTGLSNHRALQDILHQELATGMAQSLPVSLLMLDIDHFRRFNEEYGHDIGDLVLKLVATVATSYLREGDSATRYGGEEFILVFPGADSTYTSMVAEQIRQSIVDMPNMDEEDRLEFPFTVSLGYATFPIHASAAASLIKAAELALYAAKRAGRNRVVAYSPTLLQNTTHLLPSLLTATHNTDEITLPSGADLDAVQALVTAIDLRDGYTAAHSEGVSRYAVVIGTALGLPTEHIEALRLGGLIHDVGKIGVPDMVLRKPGKLDDAEWKQMQAHAVMGETILRSVEQLRHLLPLVRWHHERLDGTGYPDGLHGTEISKLVRILSIADVFEAFTAERPYHPGRSPLEGLRFLQQEGTKGRMDEGIIAVFADILAKQGYLETTTQQRNELYDAA